jgi:hypothetical protein
MRSRGNAAWSTEASPVTKILALNTSCLSGLSANEALQPAGVPHTSEKIKMQARG